MPLKFRANREIVIYYAQRIIFVLPFLTSFLIQLSKIKNDIISFSELWWVISPFTIIEVLRGGHTPYYYFLVRFFGFFNILSIAPYIYLRFINCIFNIASLVYIYKTFKEFADSRTAFFTIVAFSLGSYFLENTLTTLHYPAVCFLFFFSLFYFLKYIHIKSNFYFSLFFLGALLVTSIDLHSILGGLFMLLYAVFYKVKPDKKLLMAALVIGFNFLLLNSLIFYFSRPYLGVHVNWLGTLNNPKYFLNNFIPNFFFNSLSFHHASATYFYLAILFCFFIFTINKICDAKVKITLLFILGCLMLLGLAQTITGLQMFVTKYFIFVTPFILFLFLYVFSKTKKILMYLFCALIIFNTVVFYPKMNYSRFTHVFKAVNKYRPDFCLIPSETDYTSGINYIHEVIFKAQFPWIPVIRSGIFKPDTVYSGNGIILVSRYTLSEASKISKNLFSLTDTRYKKVFDYSFEDCPGIFSRYLIYTSEEKDKHIDRSQHLRITPTAILWEEKEITNGLGMSIVLCSGGEWYNTRDFKWELKLLSPNHIVMLGNSPELPINVIQDISQENENQIKVDIKMRIRSFSDWKPEKTKNNLMIISNSKKQIKNTANSLENVSFDSASFVLMLKDNYNYYSLDNLGSIKRFPKVHKNSYKNKWEEIFRGNATHYPKMRLYDYKHESFVILDCSNMPQDSIAVITNTNTKFSSRALICVRKLNKDNNKFYPGDYPIFNGTITVTNKKDK